MNKERLRELCIEEGIIQPEWFDELWKGFEARSAVQGTNPGLVLALLTDNMARTWIRYVKSNLDRFRTA